jgi:DNA-binding LytR/AlgR family response regulator
VGYYFYQQWDAAEKKRNEENKIRSGGIKVKTGKRDLLLTHPEIAGFLVEGDYVVCHTLQGKKFVMDQSMDNIEKVVPTSFFYRLNRQVLIHRQLVNGFERAENGKLNIMLRETSTISSPVKLSRIRAADFKKWLEPEP